jgi:hypothetical protein
MFILMPPDGFNYTRGRPKQFARTDLERPVKREFCAELRDASCHATAWIGGSDLESRDA